MIAPWRVTIAEGAWVQPISIPENDRYRARHTGAVCQVAAEKKAMTVGEKDRDYPARNKKIEDTKYRSVNCYGV